MLQLLNKSDIYEARRYEAGSWAATTVEGLVYSASQVQGFKVSCVLHRKLLRSHLRSLTHLTAEAVFVHPRRERGQHQDRDDCAGADGGRAWARPLLQEQLHGELLPGGALPVRPTHAFVATGLHQVRPQCLLPLLASMILYARAKALHCCRAAQLLRLSHVQDIPQGGCVCAFLWRLSGG